MGIIGRDYAITKTKSFSKNVDLCFFYIYLIQDINSCQSGDPIISSHRFIEVKFAKLKFSCKYTSHLKPFNYYYFRILFST